jgi:hypothetical protein
MNAFLGWWDKHGGWVMGTAQIVVVGWLNIPDFIPAYQVKHWLAINVVIGALQVGRGVNTAVTKIAAAKSGEQ